MKINKLSDNDEIILAQIAGIVFIFIVIVICGLLLANRPYCNSMGVCIAYPTRPNNVYCQSNGDGCFTVQPTLKGK